MGNSYSCVFRQISIHAPREGGDIIKPAPSKAGLNFNPRPPRGGRHARSPPMIKIFKISIHAPREGGDQVISMKIYD